ncbi:MAG TPA: SpoIID/LytB domain-containing protein, partial [Pyrinomonadaceae bacterium]|nr:SpoIID/LytB domain-containing protein [Pyrinomonadaceae bacterium]
GGAFCSSMRPMCSSLVRKAIALLLAQAFFLPIAFGQQQTPEASRPRRTQPVWTPPSATTPIIPTPTLATTTGPEPKIRVALNTDARSAVISTTGHLMNASGNGTSLVVLDTSRVRVDPRLLSPLPAATADGGFRVLVGGAASREEAEENEKDIQKITGEDAHAAYDTETKTWGMFVGGKLSREEAEEFRARLETAGIDATIEGKGEGKETGAQTQPIASNSPVRLTSRAGLPSREVVASSGAGKMFSSSAPVSFATDDEQNAPVRYNERPYRGRIEVFTNLRGTLTVVNELGLEDYVRGVVANELSPGGYPAIEAQKAQAIAARTYALKNRGQFMSQGFDILPTTRSQVYRGLTSENPLSTRAVDETRGIIATYNGEPINALYTSTCGGRTEDAEKIFNEAIPYLRAHECAGGSFDRFVIKTSREPADLQDDSNVVLARDVSLLLTQNFGALRERVSDAWLSADATAAEVRNWLANAARVARQVAPATGEDVNRPPAFATALAMAVFGESRAGTLLNDADADYLLAVKDVQEVPAANRADLAMLLRDGHLSVYPDATLRPRTPLSRARVLHTISRILEARNLLQLQKANARPASEGQLILRSSKGKDQPIRVNPDAFLFRYLGERAFAVSSVALVGGEPVTYHLAPNGQIDFLEVRPATNGAAADRFSPFANWTKGLSVAQVQARLARAARGIGSITDLRVASRGASHRVTDLEIVGTNGTAHVRGGRIRSALGLREQLFVIDREFDDNGRVNEFVFIGRGWGHGVGMCQVGAYGLARQGWSAEQIIKTYYTGVELTRLY